MLTINFVKRLTLPFLIIFLLSTSAFSLTDEDEQEIISVVSQQLQAFQDDDFEKAYSVASPIIKKIFPNPQVFGEMVVGQYQAVYRPKSVNIGSVTSRGGVPSLEVYLVDPDGEFVTAIYSMQQQNNGEWLINGCFLTQAKSSEI